MAMTMREASDDVDAFIQTAMVLIQAAIGYSEGGQFDPDVDGKIRAVRVATSALQAALMNINITPPPMVAPPQPPPVDPVPAGATAAAASRPRS